MGEVQLEQCQLARRGIADLKSDRLLPLTDRKRRQGACDVDSAGLVQITEPDSIC